MKVRLQEVVEHCLFQMDCTSCVYCKNGDCLAKIDGFSPFLLAHYVELCKSAPQLAKALYTNEVLEL